MKWSGNSLTGFFLRYFSFVVATFLKMQLNVGVSLEMTREKGQVWPAADLKSFDRQRGRSRFEGGGAAPNRLRAATFLSFLAGRCHPYLTIRALPTLLPLSVPPNQANTDHHAQIRKYKASMIASVIEAANCIWCILNEVEIEIWMWRTKEGWEQGSRVQRRASLQSHLDICRSFSPSLSPPPPLRPILSWPTPTGLATDTPTLALPVTPPPTVLPLPTLATPPLPTLPMPTLLPPLLPLLTPSLPLTSEPPLPTDSDFPRPPPTSLPPWGPSLRLPSLSRYRQSNHHFVLFLTSHLQVVEPVEQWGYKVAY